MQKVYLFVLAASCALLFNSMDANAEKKISCPVEVKSGSDFPMTDANEVTWHDSNSVNLKIDYKAVCSWKNSKATKRKEGNVCTYSTFSNCSIEGTPVGTVLYLTDYKPVIKAAVKK